MYHPHYSQNGTLNYIPHGTRETPEQKARPIVTGPNGYSIIPMWADDGYYVPSPVGMMGQFPSLADAEAACEDFPHAEALTPDDQPIEYRPTPEQKARAEWDRKFGTD